MSNDRALVAVDPGVCYAAWAVFLGDRVVLTKRGPWNELYGLIETTKPDEIVIERPRIYRGGPRHVSRDVQLLIDTVHGFIADHPGIFALFPSAWKGSVPKEVCRARIEAAGYRTAGMTHDEIDAVGIGLYAMGIVGRGMCRIRAKSKDKPG